MSETMNEDSRTFPHPVQTASALLTSTSISVDPQASHFISFDPGTPDPVAAMPTKKVKQDVPEGLTGYFLLPIQQIHQKSEKNEKN